MEEKIVLGRYKNSDFVVNYDRKKIVWQGAKGKVISKKEISLELFDYLQASTTTFKDGELVIIPKNNSKEEKERIEEVIEFLPDVDDYKSNVHTKEEVEKLLNGNINVMKKELKKVTSVSEKRFIMGVAKELNIDSSAKRKFLIEWSGSSVSTDDYFSEE